MTTNSTLSADDLAMLEAWYRQYQGVGSPYGYQQLQSAPPGVSVDGMNFGFQGMQHNDEGGTYWTPSGGAVEASDPNDPNYAYSVDPQTGALSRHLINKGDASFFGGVAKDLGNAAAPLAALYLAGTGLAAAGAGSAGGIGGSGFAAGTAGAGAAEAGAAGSGLAGDVLSKAALDGTTAFGANSVPGAFDLASTAGATGAGGGYVDGASLFPDPGSVPGLSNSVSGLSTLAPAGAGGSSVLSSLAPYGKLIGAGLMGLGGIAAGSRNGSAPTPPDPSTTANAQLQANIAAANYSAGLNRVNQNTPYGSLTYTRVPGQNGAPDQWTANVALAPAQQQLLDQSNQLAISRGQTANSLMSNAAGEFSSPVSFAGAPGLATNANYGTIQNKLDTSNVPSLVGGDQLATDLNTTRNALYQQQAAYLDPQWSNQLHDTQTQLANEGVMQNSDAWNRAMDDLNRQRTFAYQQAMNSAVTGGGAEQSRLFSIGLAANQNAFGQDLSAGNFANSAQAQGFSQAMQNANLQNAARQQSVNEILGQRNQTLNEINQFGQNSQPTTPQFGNVPQVSVGAPDIASLTQQYFANQMGGYNAGVSQNNSIMNGLFGLGAAALSGGSK